MLGMPAAAPAALHPGCGGLGQRRFAENAVDAALPLGAERRWIGGDALDDQRFVDPVATDFAAHGLARQDLPTLVAAWTGRLRDLLRADPGAAGALREVVAVAGIAAGRDVYISAAHGGVAAGIVHGSVSAGHPFRPGTDRA